MYLEQREAQFELSIKLTYQITTHSARSSTYMTVLSWTGASTLYLTRARWAQCELSTTLELP